MYGRVAPALKKNAKTILDILLNCQAAMHFPGPHTQHTQSSQGLTGKFSLADTEVAPPVEAFEAEKQEKEEGVHLLVPSGLSHCPITH